MDTKAFHVKCTEAYHAFTTLFSWASVPETLHRFLGHSWQVMERNGSRGLGHLSEEGLEALHKLVRRYRLTNARKTSLSDAIQDIMTRLLIRSDPTVRAAARVITCSNCSETGHSVRSCPLTHSLPYSRDDEAMKSFLL